MTEKSEEKFVAPDELVEPTKKVVSAAMEVVRHGELQEIDGRQMQQVALQSRDGKVLYRVFDANVTKTQYGLESNGDRGSGLFVSAIELGKRGAIDKSLDIQIPRDPGLVATQRIYTLRNLKADKLVELSVDLSGAVVVPIGIYEQALEDLARRGRDRLMIVRNN